MSAARFAVIALGFAGLTAASPVSAADVMRGAEIYRQHCANCHGATGNSTWPGAPNLVRREGLLQTDQALLKTLRAGRGAKPGYQGLLSDMDLLNVIAYCRTLPR